MRVLRIGLRGRGRADPSLRRIKARRNDRDGVFDVSRRPYDAHRRRVRRSVFQYIIRCYFNSVISVSGLLRIAPAVGCGIEPAHLSERETHFYWDRCSDGARYEPESR